MVKKTLYLFLIVFVLTGCSLPGISREETSPIETLFVGPQKVNCDNPLRNNECYQVKDNPEKKWELYKGEFMGLQYAPGYLYELKVQKDSLSNSSQNAPDQQWVLVEIVQKVAIEMEQVVTNSELTGSVWLLEQFGLLQTLKSALDDSIPTIFFQLDGHFTGSTGCNRFNGIYTLENSRIKFGSIAATKKMCSGQPGMLEQEQTILKTVESAERYQIENGKLFIFSASDAQVLVYKK